VGEKGNGIDLLNRAGSDYMTEKIAKSGDDKQEKQENVTEKIAKNVPVNRRDQAKV
jgi:hypothetical protein